MAIEVVIRPGDLERLQLTLDRDGIQEWLKEVILESRNVFEMETRKGGKGRVYRRRGKLHRASAPGDFPAVDTGRLTTRTKTRIYPMKAVLGTNVLYARFLTTGTRKMAPRKMYREAILEALKRMHGPEFVRWQA